jgi:hypothetical protein
MGRFGRLLLGLRANGVPSKPYLIYRQSLEIASVIILMHSLHKILTRLCFLKIA